MEEFVNKMDKDLPRHKCDPIFNRAACRDLSTAAAVAAILHLTWTSSESVELLISTFREMTMSFQGSGGLQAHPKAVLTWENPKHTSKPRSRASLIQQLFRPLPKRFKHWRVAELLQLLVLVLDALFLASYR